MATLVIQCESEFTGKTLYCKAYYDDTLTNGTWALTSGSQYATINSNGKIDINPGVQNQSLTVSCTVNGVTATKTISVSYDNQLNIECPDTLTGTDGNFVLTYNGEFVAPNLATLAITSGQQYATIDGTAGSISILSTGTIVLHATYNGYTATKTINLVYQANTASQTTINEDGSITTETQTITENQDGSTTTETRSITTNTDGSFSQSEIETVENEDGSSTQEVTTTNSDGTSSQSSTTTSAPDQSGTVVSETSSTYYDENGTTTGTSENTTTNNSDGSSTSTTTNYDAEGDPTSQENTEIDTDGNNSTQNIEYDDNGDPVVTGYTIDTQDGTTGGKEFNADGINTEFYGFNSVEGFTLNLHFTIDFTDQPPN